MALLKDWGIEVGDNVVINVPADVQLKEGEAVDVGALASLPNSDGTFVLAAKYDPHPIIQGFRVLTAYPPGALGLGERVGSNGQTAQNLVETTETSWAETRSQAAHELRARSHANRPRGQGGPISIAAAVAAPRLAQATPPATEAPQDTTGNAHRGVRRLGFRQQRVARDSREPQPVHECGELARAAGEPHLDSAAATRKIAASR